MMKSVTIEIMGQSLVIASDAEEDWVKAVAERVEEKMNYIRTHSRTVNSVNVAILAALNFAEELERLKLEHRELVERIDALSKRLSASIDRP